MGKPVCRICGAETQYGNLYCTVACAKEWEDKHTAHADDLVSAGFEQHPETPNIFIKDGVSVTLERTVSLGLDQTVLQHGHVAEQMATRGDAEAQPTASEASS